MTAVLAFTFGILADHYDIGVAFVVISSLLIIGTISINLMQKNNRKYS